MNSRAVTIFLMGCVSCSNGADSFALQTVDVREAVEVVPFRLAPCWRGSLTLVLPEGEVQHKEVVFTHYIRDASAHSDPDSPRPHKPAIFHGESLDHGQYSVGDVAILDTLELGWIGSWRTFGDVLLTLPDVIPIFDEEDQDTEISYWYNTFYVSKGLDAMEVIFLSFTGPADRANKDFEIKDVRVWKGTLKPDQIDQ